MTQLSSEFQTQIQPQRSGRVSNGSQRRRPIEVFIYTLCGVLIHPVTTKIQASFLTQKSEWKETVQRPMMTLKQLPPKY
jgi:hypothetical protein